MGLFRQARRKIIFTITHRKERITHVLKYIESRYSSTREKPILELQRTESGLIVTLNPDLKPNTIDSLKNTLVTVDPGIHVRVEVGYRGSI